MADWLHTPAGWTPLAGLPLEDRAWRYGLGVFETLRVGGGVAEFAAEHATRLEASARMVFGTPVRLPDDAVEGLTGLVEGGSGVLRLHLTAGDGGPSDPVTAPRLIARFEEGPAALPSGVRAMVVETPVHLAYPGLKTAHYGPHWAAQRCAKASGCDHALMLNPRRAVFSAALANLFFLRDGRLCTPAARTGARPGVVRSWVMERAEVVEVTDEACRPEALAAATGLFLTSSLAGVVPVTQLGGVAREVPGEVQALHEAFVRASFGPRPA